MIRTYDVKVVRDGKWWMIEIPELDGLTQARRLGDVTNMAVDYIALVTNADEKDVKIRIVAMIVDHIDYAERQSRLDEAKAKQAEAEQLVKKETLELAHKLADEDVPVRDIGEILGVSYQRAHQLVKS